MDNVSPKPTFDDSGYPTEETLVRIEFWPYNDIIGLLTFIQKAWSYPEYVEFGSKTVSFSTGGWSGNESLIDAFQKNHMAWMLSWISSHRGGHYEFDLALLKKVQQTNDGQ